MSETTDLLRRAAEMLGSSWDERDPIKEGEIAACLLALGDQMERAEPVGWLESPYKTFARNHAYKMTAPQATSWRIPLYTHPAPEVTRDVEPAYVAEILAEVARATAKFPTWPTDPLHALAVLGEEFGELTKDVLQMTYEPHKTTPANIRTEALQTAAMALRFFASLDRYQFQPGVQHSQSAMQEPKP